MRMRRGLLERAFARRKPKQQSPTVIPEANHPRVNVGFRKVPSQFLNKKQGLQRHKELKSP